jgi:hypothetical protein
MGKIYNLAKVKQISLNDLLSKENKYDYIVIGSAGTPEVDHSRQDLALKVYQKNPNAIILLNGYECRGKTIDETFESDARLNGRRPIFPSNDKLQIVYATNNPENIEMMIQRQNKNRKRILFITNKCARKRTARGVVQYFDQNANERGATVDVVGVENNYETGKHKFGEILADILTLFCFYGTQRGSDEKKLTKTYNQRRYSKMMRLVYRALAR